MNRTGRLAKAARSALAIHCGKIFSPRSHKGYFMHLHLSADLA